MGIRVLIAEDDQSVRHMLALALSFEDNIDQLTFAIDGEIAVELCDQIRPHVFITDSLLPKMSGADVARHCRSVNPEVRVISFSGIEIKSGDWPDEVVPKGDPDALDKLKKAIQVVSQKESEAGA
jgi:CheY-like chemotaxis protein